jgi:hypothetical protein
MAASMHLLEPLTNPTSPLARTLNAFPNGLPEPPKQRSQPQQQSKKNDHGSIQRAVIKALETATEPMTVADIRAAAELLLGRPIPNQSVLWNLHMGVKGDQPHFERVSYGVYRRLSRTGGQRRVALENSS